MVVGRVEERTQRQFSAEAGDFTHLGPCFARFDWPASRSAVQLDFLGKAVRAVCIVRAQHRQNFVH